MEMLKNKVSFKNKVKIFIPSTADVNRAIDSTAYINKALELLAGLYGGASSEQITGAWNSAAHGLVKENINGVYAYAENITDAELTLILAFIESMKSELMQEAIAIEINSIFYLI